MVSICEGRVHVPFMIDVRVKNVCSVPPPAELYDEVQRLINEKGALLNIVDRKPE